MLFGRKSLEILTNGKLELLSEFGLDLTELHF